jgi:hypothetical protein
MLPRRGGSRSDQGRFGSAMLYFRTARLAPGPTASASNTTGAPALW